MSQPDGENARLFVGQHFHEIKGAMADALNGARVGETAISPERAQQLATLCMAAMSHVYPGPPWQDEIRRALRAFADDVAAEGSEPEATT